MNLAAAVGIDRRRLRTARIFCINGNRAGVLDIQLRPVADRSDAHRADIGLRIDREVLALEIDVYRRLDIGIRDGSTERGQPCASLDLGLSRRDLRIFRKDVTSVFLTYTGIRIFDIS